MHALPLLSLTSTTTLLAHPPCSYDKSHDSFRTACPDTCRTWRRQPSGRGNGSHRCTLPAALMSFPQHTLRDREIETQRDGKGEKRKGGKAPGNQIKYVKLICLNWIEFVLFFHCRPRHFFIFLRIDFLQRNLTSNNHILCNLFVSKLKFLKQTFLINFDSWAQISFLHFFSSLHFSFVCFTCFFLSLDCSACCLLC